MASKIILDTNIILDLVLQRSNDYAELHKIYNAIVSGIFRAYTTTSIIQICSYWLEKAMGVNNSKKTLTALLNDLQVIDAPHNVVVAALLSNMTDFEDALQYYTALHHNIEIFISRDKHFIKSASPNLPVYPPLEFVKKYF